MLWSGILINNLSIKTDKTKYMIFNKTDFIKEMALLKDQLLLDKECINSLIWADDMFLFAMTEKSQTQMLNALEWYFDK